MTVDPDHAFEDAALILDQALAGDGKAVAGTFDAVVKREGASGAYNVAWCLAGELAGDGLRKGPWALDYPEIDEAQYDARWVARFVSAYVNEDEPTGEALVGAALADGRLPECLLTLAGSTVATLRRRSQP
ncbi:hypothetical protein [Catellatospora tritici]|uniref:hypothetical protein n=1 Tax=Catellatospora tritici TaxID=2851566 RepID=UPI001C2D4136|nr:hypothetical protein [Catellatospora tritici]MBV1852044.1 hypothetical protein [Catellatospora tritici]